MTSVDLLKQQADHAYSELLTALEGITEPQAWAVVPAVGDEYLHTDGSVQGVVLHIAGGKFIYGSVAFRNSEIRWRDCADRIERIEPSWSGTLDYLREAHEYWINSWAGLTDDQLSNEVAHFSGKVWPAWKIINTVIHHDAYHSGQIPVIRYACGESDQPPPSTAEDIRKYCTELPSW